MASPAMVSDAAGTVAVDWPQFRGRCHRGAIPLRHRTVGEIYAIDDELEIAAILHGDGWVHEAYRRVARSYGERQRA